MMLNENILTLLPKMAVPTIMAQLITTIYNLVDTFFVSTLGTNATAAGGASGSPIFNGKGKVIGILNSAVDKENFCRGIKASYIKELIDGPRQK